MKRTACIAMLVLPLVNPTWAADDSATGTIEGVITFRGEPPKSPVPDDAGVRRQLLEVDRKTGGLPNFVVWLATARRSPHTNAAPAVMDQRDHEFVPRVLAVRAGQPVKFSNSDPANHNVRTTSRQPTNEFNVFTGVDGSYTHRFSADPEHRPVRLGCDIHPWMRGWIYVLEHPCFAVTDREGRFRIAQVPPGRHRLILRQPDIRYESEREITVAPGKTEKVEVEVRSKSSTNATE